jgi:TPR repeat protein
MKFFLLNVLVLLMWTAPAAATVEDAAQWVELRRLAEQGDVQAQVNLGLMYYSGQEVPLDYTEALHWFRKAADRGEAAAQHNLGTIYNQGKGAPQDYKEAVRWYRKAAEQGLAASQGALAEMYYHGRGVPQDYQLAYMWSSLAAAAGDVTATNNRDVLASIMTPEQIAEGQRLAREWYERRPK